MKLIGGKIGGTEIRRGHVVAAVTGLAALILVLAWEMLPGLGLRWGLTKALRGLGMVEVSIDDGDISLFGGHLTVRKVVAQPALGSALGIGGFDLNFRWRPLLDRRLVLDRVAADGIDIDLKREAKGFVLNGLPLAAPAPSGAPASPAWGIAMAGLELSNSRLRITDGDFTATVAVERLVVENLDSAEPERAVSFALKGNLNGAAIALSGTIHPFAAEPAFAANLHAKGLSLADFAVLAARAGVAGLSGTLDPSLAAEGTLTARGPHIRTSGRAILDTPAFTLAEIKATAKRLELDFDGLSWDGSTASLAGGQIRAEALAVTAPDGQGSAAKLAVGVKGLGWEAGRLKLAGSIDGTSLTGKAEGGEGAATSLALEGSHLDWDGRRLSWQGGVRIGGAHVAVAGHDGAPDSFDWTGRLDLDTTSLAGKAEGHLTLGPLRLAVGSIRTTLKSAETQGWVEFGKATSADLSKARIAGLAVHDGHARLDLTAVDRIEAEGLKLGKDGGVSVIRLGGDGVNALRKEGAEGYSWRLETKHLRLDKAARDGDGDVTVDEIRIGGMLARVNRTPEGITGFASKDKTEPRSQDEDMPDLRIGRLVIDSGSEIRLRDRTMAETVRINVTPLELAVSGLDSALPDRDSPFEIKAGVGRGMIAASGTARPFAETVSGRIDGKITAFELPPLSPYLAEALGIQLQSGHFDGTLGVGAKEGKLAGALDVALSNLFIAPPDPNAPVAKKAEMPIETVLDLLRDGEDRIRLSLPIRGDTANPDVDISDAVAQAVAGALKSTVLTTLKLAFPVAALIEMAMDDDDKAHLALAPVTFASGSDALGPEQEKTLAGIADLLKGRPGLKLTLCGKADHSDWPVVAARRRSAEKPLLSKLEQMVGYERAPETLGPPDRNLLAALAQRRTDAVRNLLVDRAGIETSRLFGCRPMVETSGKGPRTDLLL